MRDRKIFSYSIIIVVAVVLTGSCSIQKLAVDAMSETLGGTGGSSVFTSDNDPQLVKDSLPFALKLYETLLEQNPDHTGLLLNTGSGFVMYANAFVHTPADMLPDIKYKEQERMYNRAKKLYLRGRDYLLRALEIRHPGFKEHLQQKKQQENLQELLGAMTKEDVAYLYWASAGWFGAISIDVFDVTLSVDIPTAKVLMDRAYELDPDFQNGMIHEFYITYYASMPPDMGGSEEKARHHFQKAVELTNGKSASPYVTLATTVSIKNQNEEEFTRLLNKALEIDPDADPDNRLLTIISQEKAQWYLEHKEDFFI
jgi:predicted anti-sigma-YlaC factor YlaD